MDDQLPQTCSDETLLAVLAVAERDEALAVARIGALLEDHPSDPRLHFLQGSLLAALARYDEGRAAMGRAIAIAPDYAVARFQLGLLELSSGDAAASDETLRPLAEADGESGLSLFARGLRHLARDELGEATELLRRGIELNQEHPLVSRDMEMVIARIEEGAKAPDEPGDDVSAAHLLLRRYADKNTRH